MKAKSNKRIWVEFWERMDQRTRRNFLDGFEYMAELYNEWLQDKGVVAECGFCKKMYVEADSDWYGHCSENCSLDTMEAESDTAAYSADSHAYNGVSQSDFM